MKRPLPTIYDPVEDIQHIAGPPVTDQATLCGQTDWNDGEHRGDNRPIENDPRAVNCNSCKWIFDFCNKGSWPKGAKI